MRKQFQLVLCVLLTLNLLVTAGVVVYLGRVAASETEAQRYTLYIGTNDKDTYTQLIPLDEAKALVNEICSRYTGGYTVLEAQGGWVDDAGILTEEDTLIYCFDQITKEQLTPIMDEVLQALNQNSILVESSQIQSWYYSGEEPAQ